MPQDDVLAVRSLVGDLEAALDQQHHVVAGVALTPEGGPGLEGLLPPERTQVAEGTGQRLDRDGRIDRLVHGNPIIPLAGFRGRRPLKKRVEKRA